MPGTLLPVTDTIQQIGEKFWNVRGSFKIGGLLDVGTQMSLVELDAGGFVLLDSYLAQPSVMEELRALTDGGRQITAVLNLHPFHTLHVASIAREFPDARLYGTRRHQHRAPELRWESTCTESPDFQPLFAPDLKFSVPRGVEFIPQDEKLHFSSVLAFHTRSKTLHVDDTLTYTKLPFLAGLRFHPSLAAVLEKRAGAVEDFRTWAAELIELCKQVEQVCPAHLKALPASRQEGGAIEERVQEALNKVDKVLAKHQAKFG